MYPISAAHQAPDVRPVRGFDPSGWRNIVPAKRLRMSAPPFDPGGSSAM